MHPEAAILALLKFLRPIVSLFALSTTPSTFLSPDYLLVKLRSQLKGHFFVPPPPVASFTPSCGPGHILYKLSPPMPVLCTGLRVPWGQEPCGSSVPPQCFAQWLACWAVTTQWWQKCRFTLARLHCVGPVEGSVIEAWRGRRQ